MNIINEIILSTQEINLIKNAIGESKNYFDIENIKIKYYKKNDIIVTQKKLFQQFYIILDGKVQVNTINKGLIGILKEGKWFGSLKYKFAKATLKVLEEVKIGYFLFNNDNDDNDNYDKILTKPVASILNNLNDINFSSKILGEGTFSNVYKCNIFNKKYAIKCIKKDVVCKFGAQNQIKNELNILKKLKHPFIIEFINTLQDEYAIYLITELLNGGELFKYITIKGKLDIEETKFYIANIIIALEYLHNNEIIYRDLKPENIVFKQNGYLKLIDFGFSKKIKKNDKTYTILGTPNYLAPEILSGEGYNWSIDIWSLGILLYELLLSDTPYFANDIDKLYNIITNQRLQFNKLDINDDAINLISLLLYINPKRRYGCGEQGISELKEHQIFNDYEWVKMNNQQLKPFFIPKNKKSTSNYVNYNMYTYKLNSICTPINWFPKLKTCSINMY